MGGVCKYCTLNHALGSFSFIMCQLNHFLIFLLVPSQYHTDFPSMEENSRKFNSFLGETLSFLSSDSLFSTIVTLYTLFFLYLPSIFLRFIFSPVVIAAAILLLSLLRLGATQNSEPDETGEGKESHPSELNSDQSSSTQQIIHFYDHNHKWVSRLPDANSEIEFRTSDDPYRGPFYVETFVEWDVKAPLEVIHEGYEGEEAEEEQEKKETQMAIIRRYASLSLCYPESDTDDSLEGDFQGSGEWELPENICSQWEEEDDREGLIEITLDEKRNSEVDEDNLIEIDISPA